MSHSPTFITNRLRRYRRDRGFSQRTVARLLHLESTSMISRWEQGRSLPSTMNLFRLAAVYCTLVDSLYQDFIRSVRSKLRQEHAGHETDTNSTSR